MKCNEMNVNKKILTPNKLTVSSYDDISCTRISRKYTPLKTKVSLMPTPSLPPMRFYFITQTNHKVARGQTHRDMRLQNRFFHQCQSMKVWILCMPHRNWTLYYNIIAWKHVKTLLAPHASFHLNHRFDPCEWPSRPSADSVA